MRAVYGVATGFGLLIMASLWAMEERRLIHEEREALQSSVRNIATAEKQLSAAEAKAAAAEKESEAIRQRLKASPEKSQKAITPEPESGKGMQPSEEGKPDARKEVTAKFLDLQIAQSLRQMRESLSISSEEAEAIEAAYRQTSSEPVSEALERILGPERFANHRNATVDRSSKGIVFELGERLQAVGSPLQAHQKDRLYQVIRDQSEHSEVFMGQGGAFTSEFLGAIENFYAEIQEEAAAFLSPDQMREIGKKFQRQAEAMESMARSMNPPQQPEKSLAPGAVLP